MHHGMSGVTQQNQVEGVKDNTYQSSQELDSKVRVTLDDKKDRIEQAKNNSDGKFKVNQPMEIGKKLNVNLRAKETMHIEKRLWKKKKMKYQLQEIFAS